MATLALLNLAFTSVLQERFPNLRFVSSMGVSSISRFAVVCEATVQRVVMTRDMGRASSPLEDVLDGLRVNEVSPYDFRIGGDGWLIGDGDDGMAVRALNYDTCLVWVRMLEGRGDEGQPYLRYPEGRFVEDIEGKALIAGVAMFSADWGNGHPANGLVERVIDNPEYMEMMRAEYMSGDTYARVENGVLATYTITDVTPEGYYGKLIKNG